MNAEKIVVDGVAYVRETPVTNYVIVRTRSAGVFAGEIVSKSGMEVEMKNARRLWYWSGAASLSQLALDGVSKPNQCKFPEALPLVTLTEVIEIISCSEKASASIAGVPIWKA